MKSVTSAVCSEFIARLFQHSGPPLPEVIPCYWISPTGHVRVFKRSHFVFSFQGTYYRVRIECWGVRKNRGPLIIFALQNMIRKNNEQLFVCYFYQLSIRKRCFFLPKSARLSRNRPQKQILAAIMSSHRHINRYIILYIVFCRHFRYIRNTMSKCTSVFPLRHFTGRLFALPGGDGKRKSQVAKANQGGFLWGWFSGFLWCLFFMGFSGFLTVFVGFNGFPECFVGSTGLLGYQVGPSDHIPAHNMPTSMLFYGLKTYPSTIGAAKPKKTE